MIKITKDIKSICIFRALQLGDLLCTVPAFRALRKKYPKAKITLVGLPSAKSFVERYSIYFDDFITFPGFPGLPEQPYNKTAFRKFIHFVQSKQFDVAMQMHGNGVITNYLVTLFHAKTTVGFAMQQGEKISSDFFMTYPDSLHEIRKYIVLLEEIGISSDGDHIDFEVKKSEIIQARDLLASYNVNLNRFVIIHPGASNTKKRWKKEWFAYISDLFSSLKIDVVFTGVESEISFVKEIQAIMKHASYNLIGQTTLGILAALLHHSKLLICNDTGVSHLASALAIPSIVIFSPYSKTNQWAPLNPSLHTSISSEKASLDYVSKRALQRLYTTNHRGFL